MNFKNSLLVTVPEGHEELEVTAMFHENNNHDYGTDDIFMMNSVPVSDDNKQVLDLTICEHGIVKN